MYSLELRNLASFEFYMRGGPFLRVSEIDTSTVSGLRDRENNEKTERTTARLQRNRTSKLDRLVKNET